MFIKNEKGVALVYVLMALVAVGAIGMLILSMARKEMSDTFLRTTTETARFSCNAGLTHGLNFFTNEVDATERDEILKNWYEGFLEGNIPTDANNIWIPNGATLGEFSTPDQTNGMQFRVRIVNIDFSEVKQITVPAPAAGEDEDDDADARVLMPNRVPENSPITILLNAESIDATGSRSECFGSYKIIGFEAGKAFLPDTIPDEYYDTIWVPSDTMITEVFESTEVKIYDTVWLHNPPVEIPTHAFYLGGGNMWIHAPVTISGATYVGNRTNSGTAIYHTASTSDGSPYSYYNGEFRLYQTVAGTAQPNLAYEIFNGPAYFEGGNVQFSAAQNKFNMGFGGSAIFNGHGTATIDVNSGSNAFLSGGWTGNPVNFTNSSSRLEYDGSQPGFTGETFWNGSPTVVNNRTFGEGDILTALGMDAIEPSAVAIDLSMIPESNIYDIPVSQAPEYWGHSRFIDGSVLNSWYSAPKKPLYDGEWMVLRTPAGYNSPFGNGGNFTGKAIIIHRANGGSGLPGVASSNGCADGGNILFYIPPKADESVKSVVTFSLISGIFRGFFYNGSSNTELTLAASGASWTANGAFYNVGDGINTNSSVIQIGTGGAGRVNINYCETALVELSQLGIITTIGGSGGGGKTIDYIDSSETKIDWVFDHYDTTFGDSTLNLEGPYDTFKIVDPGTRLDPNSNGLTRIVENILQSITTKLESRSF